MLGRALWLRAEVGGREYADRCSVLLLSFHRQHFALSPQRLLFALEDVYLLVHALEFVVHFVAPLHELLYFFLSAYLLRGLSLDKWLHF